MKIKYILVLLLAMFVSANKINAQILNPKKLLQQKVTNKTNQVINKKTDQAVDSIFNNNGNTQKSENKQVTQKNIPQKEASVAPVENNQPSLQSYSKFDFVPGEKVILFDDFSQDNVGDFPALWNTNGSAEVVTNNLFAGHWMSFVTKNTIWTDELLKLPENYTIEFDVIPIGGLEGAGMSGYDFRLMQAKNAKAWDAGSAPGDGGFLFSVEYFGRPGYATWMNKEGCQESKLSGYNEGDEFKEKINQKYHISIWVQKSRIRLYQNENKLFDLPRAFPTNCLKPDRIRFEEGAAMISNVRIAVGAPDMRSKLITEGKLVSYGIYFDVNKDVVKPESYGTLKGIADVLNENPGLRIQIVGHTDADGNDAANLDLSKRRAASVRDELVKNFSIDVSRIETDGKGKTQPIAPNDSPSNKALNRRVEFIKL